MKKLNRLSLELVFILSLLLLFACKEDTSLVAPVQTSVSSEGPNWISLPISDNGLQKTFMVTKQISQLHGGIISLKNAYMGGPHGEVKVSVKMNFPPNAVNEDTEFTMTLNDETGMISLSPSMAFNIDVALTIELKGMDLGGVDKDQIDFVYCDADGQFNSIGYNKLQIDTDGGEFGVLTAQIPYLSRCGVTNKIIVN